MRYKVNNNVVFFCKYHVVWCPKYRRKVLTDEIAMRLKELIYERAAEIGADIIEMEIMPDYVRLLIEIDPQFGINRAIRSIKGFTSSALRNEFPELKSRLPTLWTSSYFVSSEDDVPLDAITQYIQKQNKDPKKCDSQSDVILYER